LARALKVLDYIARYTPLKTGAEELEKTKKEISDKATMLNALKYNLGEAQREYDANADVRLVVALLVNPRGFKQDRAEMAMLIARVLESGAGRIQERPEPFQLPSTVWGIEIENMRNRPRGYEGSARRL
jgi:hypothetical protein